MSQRSSKDTRYCLRVSFHFSIEGTSNCAGGLLDSPDFAVSPHLYAVIN